MGKEVHLTDEEIDLGMETVWKTLEEVLDILKKYIHLFNKQFGLCRNLENL